MRSSRYFKISVKNNGRLFDLIPRQPWWFMAAAIATLLDLILNDIHQVFLSQRWLLGVFFVVAQIGHIRCQTGLTFIFDICYCRFFREVTNISNLNSTNYQDLTVGQTDNLGVNIRRHSETGYLVKNFLLQLNSAEIGLW